MHLSQRLSSSPPLPSTRARNISDKLSIVCVEVLDGINCVLFVFELRYITDELFNVDVVTYVFEVFSVNVNVVLFVLVGNLVYGDVCESGLLRYTIGPIHQSEHCAGE